MPGGFVPQFALEQRLPGKPAPWMGVVRFGDRHVKALWTKHFGATRAERLNFVPRPLAEVLGQIIGRQNNFISDDAGTTRDMLDFQS